MTFTKTEVKRIFKHVTTRLLSLGKFIERVLLKWDVLESYFLSEFEDKDKTKDDDKVNQEVRLSESSVTPSRNYIFCLWNR